MLDGANRVLIKFLASRTARWVPVRQVSAKVQGQSLRKLQVVADAVRSRQGHAAIAAPTGPDGAIRRRQIAQTKPQAAAASGIPPENRHHAEARSSPPTGMRLCPRVLNSRKHRQLWPRRPHLRIASAQQNRSESHPFLILQTIVPLPRGDAR